MEVVPTGDGEDDDGVVWYRCPQCQGFLPKLKGSDPAAGGTRGDGTASTPSFEEEPAPGPEEAPPGRGAAAEEAGIDDDLPWDSPADMMASGGMKTAGAEAEPGTADEVDGQKADTGAAGRKGAPEPVAEYAALLEQADQGDPRPYRPWDTYEVGDCIMHLAWEDCGVVVAKENLPGGRRVIKCYFGEAGVVRLIEQAPR